MTTQLACIHWIPYCVTSVIYTSDHTIIPAFISPEHHTCISNCLPDTPQIIPNSHPKLLKSSQRNYDLPTLTSFFPHYNSCCFFFKLSSIQLQNIEIKGSLFTLCLFLKCRFDENLIISCLWLKIPKCLPRLQD